MGKKTVSAGKKITICRSTAVAVISVAEEVKKISGRAKASASLYTVKTEIYENVIEIAGTISAAEQQTLQALSDGTVLAVYVEKGDTVKKGDIIIQLDATEQEYNLAKLDYDMASTKITGSQKQLELQQKQRLSLLQKIEDRKVKATFDGIIADLDVSVGDSMEAKDSVGTLVNVDYLIAEVEIPETDVSNLKIGQKVEFAFPAYNGTVEGYVVSWPAIGEVTSRGATIVKAKIRIDDYPPQILPNYSFTGKIQITEPVENVIVESYAVAREKGRAYVELAATGERIYVNVSPYGSGYLKIATGLSGGEVLKAQSAPKRSGTDRARQKNDFSKNNENRGGSMGGGMGRPPF